ncbi:MAG TPA: hypothetical protein VGL08_16770 [Paraburkholderia sp.]|jgi:hypothetical protein
MNAHETLEAAVRAYFFGQRYAAVLGGIASLVMLAVAIAMLVRGDAFMRGLAMVLVLIALTGAGAGAALAICDAPKAEAMMRVTNRFSIQQEAARMERVIDNYRYYHVAFAGFACFAVILLLLTMTPTWQGVAVGLLVLAGLGVTYEHFDRQQAIIYLAALKPSRCV